MTESCSACFTKTGKPKKLRYTYAGEARHHALIASLRAERDQLDKDVMTEMGTIQKIVAERDELLELVRTAKNWFENEYPSPSPQWTFRASSALQRGKV